MDIAELEKLYKELGAQMMTIREELKVLQNSKTSDPSEIKSLRDDLAALKKSYDDVAAKLSAPPPDPKKQDPEPDTKPKPKTRAGFGFFQYGGSDE